MKDRKLGPRGLAIATAAAAVVLVVLLNLLVSALSSRFTLSIDMTEGRIYSLSEEARTLAQEVSVPVDIYVLRDREEFVAQNRYFRQANEVMNRLSRQNGNIRLHYIDLVRQPLFLSDYADLGLTQDHVLVESGDKTAVLHYSDLFATQMDYNTFTTVISSSRAEQALLTAIRSVTSDESIEVCFLTGHGETELDSFTQLLEMNGYVPFTQNLLTEEIRPNARLVVLAAPVRDLSEEEAAKLDRFLENDGALGNTLLYFASASQPQSLPVLEAFLADWGIQAQPGVVLETDTTRLLQGNTFMVLADYAEAVYSADAAAQNLPMVLSACRPLKLLYTEDDETIAQELVRFSDTAVVMPPDADEDWQMEEALPADAAGMVLSRKSRVVDNEYVSSNVVAAGTQLAVDGGVLDNANLGNAEYLLGLLGQLNGAEQAVYLREKSIDTKDMGITSFDVAAMSIMTMGILPAAILLYGLVVWRRRRHR